LYCKESDERCCPHGQQGIYCSTTGVRRIGSRSANIHKPDPLRYYTAIQKILQTPVTIMAIGKHSVHLATGEKSPLF